MLSVRCLSVCLSVCHVLSVCLSVTLVYCGQTVKWIKMKHGMEVGLGPGHIVSDGDPAPPKKAHSPLFSAHVYCGQTVAHLSYDRAFLKLGCIVCPRPITPQWLEHVPI